MKWISLCLLITSVNTYAAQQFTEAECILLEHQATDYKRRLGVNSDLHQQTNTSVKKHCKTPISTVKKRSQVLTTLAVNNITPITPNNPVLSKIDTKKPNSAIIFNPLDMIIKAFSFSWPIWIVLLLLTILRLPSVKGRLGELYVSKGLRNRLPNDQYSIINDVTLTLDDGGTTQVDHIVVSPFGVFVIETKNMKGWIFGSEKQAKWTQTIYRTKHTFQNPLRQNYKHTQTLAKLLNLPTGLFHSVIIFTPSAELKTNIPPNVGHLKGMIAFIMSFKTSLIKPREQLEIEKSISNIRLKRGLKTNKDHVRYLKSKHG